MAKGNKQGFEYCALFHVLTSRLATRIQRISPNPKNITARIVSCPPGTT